MNKLGFGYLRLPQKDGMTDYEAVNALTDRYRKGSDFVGNYRNFKLVTYFIAQAAAHIAPEELETQLDFITRHLRLDKVYLEP